MPRERAVSKKGLTQRPQAATRIGAGRSAKLSRAVVDSLLCHLVFAVYGWSTNRNNSDKAIHTILFWMLNRANGGRVHQRVGLLLYHT